MKKICRRVMHAVALVMSVLLASWAMAGSLNPTNAPGPTMHTLEEIYQKIQSLDPDAQQLLSATTAAVNGGYYAATNLTLVDINLATANIKAGISIFGVAGAQAVVDTSTGTATAGDMLASKTAYVNGTLVTGTMASQTMSSSNSTMAAGYYAATNLTAVDTDLTAGNIATNVTLFGIAGTLSTTPAAVPKTGQTTSYAAWDDGVYQMGVAFPLPRFTIQSDTNCILDNMTGLIWARNANLGGSMSWSAAIVYCEALNYGGQTDWRLPNRNELNSLIDSSNYSPALPLGHPFVGVQNYHYWSGTSYVGNTGDAWCVGIGTGYVFNYSKPTNTYYVWPVRGGQ